MILLPSKPSAAEGSMVRHRLKKAMWALRLNVSCGMLGGVVEDEGAIC